MIRTLSVVIGALGFLALGPAAIDAKTKKPSCVKKKEQAGCKLKSAKFSGTADGTGRAKTYGIVLTIGDHGYSSVRGSAKPNCSGGAPNQQVPYYLPLTQTLKLPKTLTVGNTYSKSGHIDKVEDTGQIKVRFVANESVRVKILSAKKAKVTISIDHTTQNVEPPDENPPVHCVASGVETIKRNY